MKPSQTLSWLFFAVGVLLARCSESTMAPQLAGQLDANAQVAYLRDTTLFVYRLSEDTTLRVAELSGDCLLRKLESINDSTVMVPYRGELLDSAFYNATGEWMKEPPREDEDYYVFHGIVGSRDIIQFTYYQTTYLAINIHSGRQWRYKTVDFRAYANDARLTMRTTHFNESGHVVSMRDSVTDCYGKSRMDWINYCNPLDRGESFTNTVGGRQVHAFEGSLFLVEDGIERMLLKNPEDQFDMKYGNGYSDVALSPDGRYTAFREFSDDYLMLEPCLFTKKDNGIREMDLNTHKIKTIIPENGWGPAYSPGGNYLLLGRLGKECDNDRPINEMHIYERSSGILKFIGLGWPFVWMKGKNPN